MLFRSEPWLANYLTNAVWAEWFTNARPSTADGWLYINTNTSPNYSQSLTNITPGTFYMHNPLPTNSVGDTQWHGILRAIPTTNQSWTAIMGVIARAENSNGNSWPGLTVAEDTNTNLRNIMIQSPTPNVNSFRQVVWSTPSSSVAAGANSVEDSSTTGFLLAGAPHLLRIDYDGSMTSRYYVASWLSKAQPTFQQYGMRTNQTVKPKYVGTGYCINNGVNPSILVRFIFLVQPALPRE